MIKVFVYGTLKPGGHYHQEYCGEGLVSAIPALTRGQLFDFPHLGYPGMTPGTDWVQGYLLTFCSEAVLVGLDALEDYDPTRPRAENEYWRERVVIFDLDYQKLELAWAYFMDTDRVRAMQGIYLANGDWPVTKR
ncbi:MAG: gamma-glutamylcyclotransferase [Cyanobacteria bacterium J06635_1]